MQPSYQQCCTTLRQSFSPMGADLRPPQQFHLHGIFITFTSYFLFGRAQNAATSVASATLAGGNDGSSGKGPPCQVSLSCGIQRRFYTPYPVFGMGGLPKTLRQVSPACSGLYESKHLSTDVKRAKFRVPGTSGFTFMGHKPFLAIICLLGAQKRGDKCPQRNAGY